MAAKPIDVYLNDHLGGATFGADLARQLEARTEGTAFQLEMSRLAADIEADLETLTDLMERLGVARNPVKKATGWVAEKASQLKFNGLTSANGELGTFLGLEALSLGAEGKASLWRTLLELRQYPELTSVDLDRHLHRAHEQRQILETERVAAARRSLYANADG
jgi:hypothetical protein